MAVGDEVRGSSELVTIKQVAKRAGVSPATVSNVLRGRKRVRPEYAKRVREAVDALGYQVDRAASHLRSGESRVVAMIVPSLENPFFTSIVAAVEKLCHRDGYEMIVASSDHDDCVERARLGALLSWRPAGLVVVPNSFNFPSAAYLDGAGVPYVIADRWVDASEADTVTIDNAGAGRLAAEHLVSLGHREITVCASSLAIPNIGDRTKGVREALIAHGLPAPELLEVGEGLDSANRRLGRWPSEPPAATAFIALTNFATLALLGALARTGVDVPAQASVVGFDDYVWMQATAPSVTAVRQPVAAIAEHSWGCLFDRIAGGAPSPRRVQLEAELVVRESTSALQPRAAAVPDG